MAAERTYRRKKKIVDPRLQLKLTGTFVGLAVLGLLMQFAVLGYRMLSTAEALQTSGGDMSELLGMVPSMLLESLLFSFAVIVPIIVAIGIQLTFRIAGPVYRFEVFLGDVAKGKQVEPCRIRNGDHFQKLCGIINEATADARARAAEHSVVSDETTGDTAPEKAHDVAA